MAEAVVVRRARILDPPVAARDAVVGIADSRAGGDPVHHAPETEGAGRGGSIALALVDRDPTPAEPGRPGARNGAPAATGLAPAPKLSLGRGRPGSDDRDELGRRACREAAGQVRRAGGRTGGFAEG